MSSEPQAIVVAGDLVLDHHIYEGRRHHYGDGSSPGVNVRQQAGGAALVHELLCELLAKPAPDSQPDWISHLAVEAPASPADCLGVDPSQHAYAFWRPFPRIAPPDKQFWRCSEAMGFGATSSQPTCTVWPPAKNLPAKPSVILFSEGGMGFRQNKPCWEGLPLSTADWIVLKTAAPVACGELWTKLTAEPRDNLIVIVSAQELRESTARLTAGVSWDDTVQRLLSELQPGRALAPLMKARHLLVVFSAEGAVWLDVKSGQVHLVYDAASIEGEQAQEVDGTAFGFLSCLAAATAWQIALNKEQPDLEAAAEGGLAAMRDLRDKGHGAALDDPDGFPAKRLAQAIRSPSWRYSRARFSFSDKCLPATGAGGVEWSILQEAERGLDPAYELAKLVALRGPVAVRNVPHLAIGKLLTVDRRDIEALRNLSKAIRRYRHGDPGKKPLSIGVFGPPGAGKSFSVKQLANKFVGADSWMEFNLSQFASPDDLIGAFHQVRDKVLQGHLPVAFFDEFDSQKYRWLQHLLAPMQDGHFQEGQITHPIGKCIFIFAGGTSWTFGTFGPPELDGSAPETDAHADFRLAKGPDFKSRLDAYLDVVGPNRRQVATLASGNYAWDDDPGDIYFPIRRAFMIRSELNCSPEQKLELDEGVLQALLRVSEYRHGSRSLGKTLQPFQANLSGPLTRSLLPSSSQLAMHTIVDEFMRICESASARAWTMGSMSGEQTLGTTDPLTEADITLLAPAVHKYYQDLGLKEKWKVQLPDFSDLDDFTKASNRAAARRMIRILDLAGLHLVSGVASAAEEDAVRRYVEFHLELLAEAEHDGWMQWHLNQGWRYAKKTNKQQKQHECLLPYEKLSQEQQKKDCDSVRHYPDFARLAGRKISFRSAGGQLSAELVRVPVKVEPY